MPLGESAYKAAVARIIVARAGVPPPNGSASLDRLKSTLQDHDLYYFTYKEFCVQAAVADSDPVGQLRALRAMKQSVAMAALRALPPEASGEQRAAAEAAVARTAVKLEHPLSSPSSTDASLAYAPSAVVATENTLDHVGTASTLMRFVDPLDSDRPESASKAGDRVLAQQLFETAFLPNHPNLLKAVAQGDIASMWARAQALCVGDDTASALRNIVMIGDLIRSPPATWPVLAQRLLDIQIALRPIADKVDSPLHLGPAYLPAAAMRALQHRNFEDLRVEVTMLGKLQEALTVERILQDIGEAHTKRQLSGDHALAASVPATPPNYYDQHVAFQASANAGRSDPQPCFFFRDNGHCKFGDNCRFAHGPPSASTPPLTGTCYNCNSSAHGIQDCPTFKKQAGTGRRPDSQVSVRTKKSRALKARCKAAEAKLAELVVSDKYAPYGPGGAPGC